MKKHNLVLVFAIAAVALAGCGTSKVDRTASGAGIGAGTGALAGLAFGGVAVTNKDQVYLGQAIWDNRSNQGG
jgi:hypothetical protein